MHIFITPDSGICCIYLEVHKYKMEWKINIHFWKLTDIWIQIVLFAVGKILNQSLNQEEDKFPFTCVTVSRNSGKMNKNAWIIYLIVPTVLCILQYKSSIRGFMH